MALAADRNTKAMDGGAMPTVLTYKVKTGVTIYKGALVGVDTATGYLVPVTAATTIAIVGRAEEGCVAGASASGTYSINVRCGVLKYKNSAVAACAITNLGQMVYGEDDETISGTSQANTLSQAGLMVKLDADGGIWVCTGPYPVQGSTYVTTTAAQTLTNKILTTPTIASFANATHDHSNAAGGGATLTSPTIVTPTIAAAGWTGANHTHAGATTGGAIAYLSIKGIVELPLTSFGDADGDVVKFANAGADGLTIADSKAVCLRFNNAGAPPKMIGGFTVPLDCDITAPINLKFLVSKTGATNNAGNTTTITVEAFNQVDGALHDVDVDYGGTTDAVVPGAAAKTLDVLTLVLAALNLPAVGSHVSLTIKPTDGTLDTDDFCIHRIYAEYTKLVA